MRHSGIGPQLVVGSGPAGRVGVDVVKLLVRSRAGIKCVLLGHTREADPGPHGTRGGPQGTMGGPQGSRGWSLGYQGW